MNVKDFKCKSTISGYANTYDQASFIPWNQQSETNERFVIKASTHPLNYSM